MDKDYAKGGSLKKGGEIKISELKKGDRLVRKGSTNNYTYLVKSVEKDWRSGYYVVELYDDVIGRSQKLIDVSNYEMAEEYAKGGLTKKKYVNPVKIVDNLRKKKK